MIEVKLTNKLLLIHSFAFLFKQDGIAYSFGVLLPSLSEYFESSKASTMMIFSLLSFMIQVS